MDKLIESVAKVDIGHMTVDKIFGHNSNRSAYTFDSARATFTKEGKLERRFYFISALNLIKQMEKSLILDR